MVLALPGLLITILGAAQVHQGLPYDSTWVRYVAALASASSEGLPSFVEKLAVLSREAQSPVSDRASETLEVLGMLHPGLVPDRGERIRALRARSQGDPARLGRVAALEILEKYYASALRGQSGSAEATLSGRELEGWLPALQARADAAFRAGRYAEARALAYEVLERDPQSPLLASTHVMLGLCDAFEGNPAGAARCFQRALSITPVPTIHGDTRSLLALAFRFVRLSLPGSAALFADLDVTPVSGAPGLKEPVALHYDRDKWVLLDREAILEITAEGRVTNTRPARNLEDLALPASGSPIYLADDSWDPGKGVLSRLALSVGGKPRELKKLRALCLESTGELLFADEDLGLLRGKLSSSGHVELAVLSTLRGRLVRVDRRGNIYLLSREERSIFVLDRAGKPLATIQATRIRDREGRFESFALDALNHVFILDTGTDSIRVLAMNEGPSGLTPAPVTDLPLDTRRPQLKNLKVLAVAPSGELAITGRNDNAWVVLR